jgi:hypothetical protein
VWLEVGHRAADDSRPAQRRQAGGIAATVESSDIGGPRSGLIVRPTEGGVARQVRSWGFSEW